MRKITCLVIALLMATAAFAQATTKPQENDNPKDYGNDFQVPEGGAAAVALTEDFEAGTPPAGWSVVDNAGNGLVWTNLAGCGEAGNFTNGSGDVACASSDVFGTAEYDTELITGSYDFCAGDGSSLHVKTNYQNLAGLDFFEIDASTNGGGAWSNLLSWNEDHGTFRGTPGADINLGLGSVDGEANVTFRFHYFDPNTGDWDWYIQIDDYELQSDGTIAEPGGDSCGPAGPVPAAGNLGIALVGLALLAGGTAWVMIRRRRAPVA